MKTLALLAVLLLSASRAGAAPAAPPVISTGAEVALAKHLAPEQATLFIFLKPSSSLEKSFLQEVLREAAGRVGIRLIHLKTGDEPAARQHQVKETPSAIVYDRRGRMTGRGTSGPDIMAAARRAAGVMRIDWAEPGDPRLAEAQRLMGGRSVPEIMRTMSLRPELMGPINELAMKAHFSDGFLDRRTKEMIATYVSSINKCKY